MTAPLARSASSVPLERLELAGRLAFVVGSMQRKLRPSAEALTHVGISALASIARAECIRPGDLARIEGIGAPSMTRLLADLEQRGLVIRANDPDDGRSTLFRTTSAGDEALLAARHDRAARVEQLLADCSNDDLEAIGRTVAILESALAARH